jgi:hypothetical protein
MTVPLKKGERGEGGDRRERDRVCWLSGWGDNRKIACSAQRRVGLKARPTAGAPAPRSPVRTSFP